MEISMDPEIAACLDKQVGDTCDDYKKYSGGGGCVVCVGPRKGPGFQQYSGGKCETGMYDGRTISCRGAAVSLGQRSSLHTIAVLVIMISVRRVHVM